ncbi:hypothetical protein, partial [Pollutimonas bauzanensis]|uniref:hypothetical protein n=1 Tax=Pollutimonas bauzanensis TaxID=658167 RepID=UPI00333FDC26
FKRTHALVLRVPPAVATAATGLANGRTIHRSPSVVCLPNDCQRHAKMPSTQPVPSICQLSILQRGRSYEAVLQRLSGRASRTRKEPEWADEWGDAGSAPQGDEPGNEERNTAS